MRQETARGSASGRSRVAVRTILPPSGAAASPDSDSRAPTATSNVAVALRPSGSVAVAETVASPGRTPRTRSPPEVARTETAAPSEDAE